MNFIFDLYGTLIDIWTDENRPQLWRGVASFLGEGEDGADRVREEYLALCGGLKKSPDHEIDLLCVFREMLSVRGLDTGRAQALASEFRRLSMVRLKRFHGVKSMLIGLKKQGGGVYLLSNAQSCFTIDELKATGLYRLFDGILISSDVGIKKPSSKVFELAFERFGISGNGCVYVGNDLHDDVLGATGVGIRTVYIETAQSGSYEGLDLPKPTYTVKSHREMKALLDKILKRMYN